MGGQLSQKLIKKISRRVSSRFPELRGVEPRVQARSKGGEDEFLLHFRTKVTLADGKTMYTNVRVRADAQGKITKLTVSR